MSNKTRRRTAGGRRWMVLGCGSVSALRTMKRFFQVVPSPKQVAAGVVAVPPPAKKPKADDDVGPVRDPLSFITYNCNSLFARASRQQLESIIQYVLDEDPDMVSIQEARLPALKQGGCVSRYAIGPYLHYWSLADKGTGGTLTLIKRECRPDRIMFNFEQEREPHDSEGRIFIGTFRDLTVFSCYAPNNGLSEEHLRRRELWDYRVMEFVRQMANSGRNLIWMGDLNCAPSNFDMSHMGFFKARKQPGCTDLEQERMRRIMSAGRLIDAYVATHPRYRQTVGVNALHPSHTWRGNDAGMYANKSMRIDLILVSEALRDRLIYCESRGADKWSSFMGSDHCPVKMCLRPPSPTTESTSAEQLPDPQ
ncbi:unnamed protein product (mitochondrion) [Plasmodiophora brassicae]|uniref:DNA-(apurinic or apyrimidinic site) endonuclease n=1 Tax=Plasmodiophora brassicae TaxID=37360 RepID=A0A3P3YJL0_PLABS|nr:unnamed protein product [Plasmodiophora brassicae]